MIPISAVNDLSYEDFISTFQGALEHGALAAATVWSLKPFTSVDEMHQAFSNFLDDLSLNGTLIDIVCE